MRNTKKRCTLVLIILLLTAVLVSCGKQEAPKRTYENMQDAVYEIVSGSEVPHKVNEKIYKEREKGFGFSYRDNEGMYIAFGFGRQNTGGFSIQLVAVKENEDEILIEAKLIAPAPEEVVSTSPSYPYMILKMEDTSKNVEFILY